MDGHREIVKPCENREIACTLCAAQPRRFTLVLASLQHELRATKHSFPAFILVSQFFVGASTAPYLLMPVTI